MVFKLIADDLYYDSHVAGICISPSGAFYICSCSYSVCVCYQKDNERAKVVREHEEKLMVSAWYNMVSTLYCAGQAKVLM